MKKFLYLYVLQGDYGYGHGWEDLTASENFSEVYTDKKEYRENEGGLYRIIKRREKNPKHPAHKGAL